MEAKDLRIGNYIADYDCEPYYFQVEEIKKNVGNVLWVNYRKGSIKAKTIEPVQLTEDWLLKFGFNNEDYIDGYIGVTNNGISFALNKPNETKEYYTFEISHGRVPIIIKFNYVHELQNLYHSLTGEELIIKEQ